MKAILSFILICLFQFGFSQAEEFEKGNQAYENENYKEAIESYNGLVEKEFLSAELFYNLGNAYYRDDQLGEAVWSFEKALKIDPSNSDIKENLDFCIAESKDKIDNSKPGVGTWIRKQLFGSGINLWAYISILSSILLSISLLIFFRTKKRNRRNLGLFLGGACSILLLVSILSASMHKNSIINSTEGIIVNETSIVKLSPLETAKKSFELHEGTKVHILETNEDWIQIEVNNNRGWLDISEVWKI